MGEEPTLQSQLTPIPSNQQRDDRKNKGEGANERERDTLG